MSNSLFNESMSINEARLVLFSAVDGKTKEEIEKLKADYYAIQPILLNREINLASKGWLIN